MTTADPARWRVLAVTLVVGFMTLLDVTIVNVALPSMRAGLGADPGTIQWVVSGYALAFGLVLVTGGRLGDAWGRRRMMLIGLTGFVVASAACGLAPTVELLILARLAQGVAAGLLTPQNSGIIQQLFAGAERGRAFGMFGFVVSVSSGIGPVLGGVLIALAGEEQGWRWIFWINVPIGLALLIPIARMVPGRDASAERRPGLDLPGALWLGLAVLALLYPVVSLESGQRLPLLLLVVVPLLAWAFVRRERAVVRRGGAPLLDVGLLRRTPGYASGTLIGALYFSGFTGVFLVLSVFLQEGLGWSPLVAGALLTPFAVGSAISSPIAGRLVSRVGRVLTVRALLLMMSGLVALAVVVPWGERTAWLWLLVAVPLLVSGLGGGAVVSPNFTLSLADVPPRMGGAAGGALQTGQRIGSAIGAAVLATTYQVALDVSGDPGLGLVATVVVALVILSGALAAAIWSWRTETAYDATPAER